MHRKAWTEPCVPRQETARQIERHAVEVYASQLAETDVDPRHQRERGEEVLAELTIRAPPVARDVTLERERVDEYRSSVLKLHVVRARVLQRHALLERPCLDPQREQCRVLQLTKAPFEGIR